VLVRKYETKAYSGHVEKKFNWTLSRRGELPRRDSVELNFFTWPEYAFVVSWHNITGYKIPWIENSIGEIEFTLDAGMWRYHANRMDARRSQFDLGRVVAYI